MKFNIEKKHAVNLSTKLAEVIAPSLKMYRQKSLEFQSPTLVRDEDVPEKLRTGVSLFDETDEQRLIKWDWVMDEMIFAFEAIATDAESKATGDKVVELVARVGRGLHLFAIYMRSLWL